MSTDTNDTSVVIIGAGPAGLATAAILNQYSVKHILLDKADRIGGAYARMRSDLHLLSPPCFNSLPLSENKWKHSHTTAAEYLAYLQEYANTHNIKAHLNQAVNTIEKTANGYLIKCNNGTSYRCQFVVHAIGMASFTRQLPLNIEQNSSIQLLNCIDVHDTTLYQGKRILIIGSGTSALETAMLLSSSSKVTVLANKPLSILDTSFMGIDIHYWTRPLEKLPRFMYKKACSGRFREPAICNGAKRAIKSGMIQVQQGAINLEQDRLQFDDGSTGEFDYIINCSGYRYSDDLLPNDIQRSYNGNSSTIATRLNESISHAGLFLLGYRCANSIDSVFLRGIRRDAVHVATTIAKTLNSTET